MTGTALRKRGVDHLVLCVRDLEAARDIYRRLGFTLTPRALHPFGTGNSLVQLRGSYIELLTVVDPAKIVPPREGEFSFASFNQRFLARREGFSMLALTSEDARADRDEFVAAGLTTYPPFDFSRKAKLPEGEDVTVSFSLVFLGEASMPEAGFFTCQHHTPHFFWDPDYQSHANGALAMVEIVMMAPDPRASMGFFARLLGRDAMAMQDGQLVVALSRGRIVVLDPKRTADRFPGFQQTQAPASPHFIGYRLTVRDFDSVALRLDAAGISYRRTGDTILVGPEMAFGVSVEFGRGE
jgi:catechol 2,3-dioxygenase-like lactoylglutathione lyase family enzyme